MCKDLILDLRITATFKFKTPESHLEIQKGITSYELQEQCNEQAIIVRFLKRLIYTARIALTVQALHARRKNL